MAAAFGVKLARPDQPVVSVVGDGSFCFSGPQPLWSMARYKAPVMTIVLNNRSYNNERNRIWHGGGRQFKTGRDMTCYIGSPDVDYAKAAGAFGVEGEAVKEPGELKAAIGRAQRVDRRRAALSARHSYLARRHRGGLDLASALLGRRHAHAGRCECGTPCSALAARRARVAAACRLRAQTAPPARCRPAKAATCWRPRARSATCLERHHGRCARGRRVAAPRPQHGDCAAPS